jgi:hypothetical protein
MENLENEITKLKRNLESRAKEINKLKKEREKLSDLCNSLRAEINRLENNLDLMNLNNKNNLEEINDANDDNYYNDHFKNKIINNPINFNDHLYDQVGKEDEFNYEEFRLKKEKILGRINEQSKNSNEAFENKKECLNDSFKLQNRFINNEDPNLIKNLSSFNKYSSNNEARDLLNRVVERINFENIDYYENDEIMENTYNYNPNENLIRKSSQDKKRGRDLNTINLLKYSSEKSNGLNVIRSINNNTKLNNINNRNCKNNFSIENDQNFNYNNNAFLKNGFSNELRENLSKSKSKEKDSRRSKSPSTFKNGNKDRKTLFK